MRNRNIEEIMRRRGRSGWVVGPLFLALTLWWSAAWAADSPETPRRVRILPAAPLGVTHAAGFASSRADESFYVLERAPGADAWRVAHMDRFGEPLGAPVAFRGAFDPVNVAYDSQRGRLMLFDSATHELVEVPAAAGGALAPDQATRTRPAGIGPLRAAGLTIDERDGSVALLDRLTGRIVRIRPSQTDGARAWSAASAIELDGLAGVELYALIFNPANQHFYMISHGDMALREVDASGKQVRVQSLDRFQIGEAGAIAWGPTGDQTDATSEQSLYILDRARGGRIVEFTFDAPARPLARIEALLPTTLVRTVETSRFSPPSPDPSGIAYDPVRQRLVIDDGEVEEMSIWHNANVFETTLNGALTRSWSTTRYSIEPVGMAFDPLNRHLYISDDDARKVFDVDPGPDNLPGTTDDVVTSFSTTPFSSGDPEGITLDAVGRRIYIADGVNAEVYVIAPGPNGKFDGVDDVVTHFDTKARSITDPETVEFNPLTGTLFTMGSGSDVLVELTTTGALRSTYDVSALSLSHAAGMAFAPGSTNPTAQNLYIVDRVQDNDSHSSENDGKLYEISFTPIAGGGPGGGPLLPEIRVAASSDDAEEKLSGSVSLTSDLELVDDSGPQIVGVRFAGVPLTRGAKLKSASIQFTTDETGSGACALVIHGQAADDAAAFTTSTRNVSSRARTADSVTWSPAAWNTVGEAGANQRTPNLARLIEQIVARPGWASGHALAFVIRGTGKRVARSYDDNADQAPLLLYEIETGPPPPNQRPVVEAGPDLNVTLPAEALLDATVSDDGLPSTPGVLSYAWTRASGPGTVTFSTPNAADTRATFTVAGTYVLKLSVSDGALSTIDSARVVVAPALPTPPAPKVVEVRVAADTDDAEEKSGGSVSLDSSDLELVEDSSPQVVGMRFNGVAIPRGARVLRAWIQFQVDEATSGATTVTFRGQAADNPTTFTSASSNLSTRATTTESVSWTPPAWNTVGQAGLDQRTPDLSAIVQAMVNRTGWTNGNSMVLLVRGSGRRTAEAHEGDAPHAPLLHIEIE